jgi:CheY-specific phosphatase CheX
MGNYNKYYKCIARSVDHIFKSFLKDNSIQEVFESQSSEKDPKVSIEIEGTLSGEIILNIPEKTLNLITRFFIPGANGRSLKNHHPDVAGELANMISGTFANQLQFINHRLRLSAPEYNDDPLTIKAFYENVNISFSSNFGGFDIDLYYKENL